MGNKMMQINMTEKDRMKETRSIPWRESSNQPIANHMSELARLQLSREDYRTKCGLGSLANMHWTPGLLESLIIFFLILLLKCLLV